MSESEKPVPVVGCVLAREALLDSIDRQISRNFWRMLGSGLLGTVAFGGAAWIGEGMFSRIDHNEFDPSEIIPGSIALILLALSVLLFLNARNRYQDRAAAVGRYNEEAERPIPHW